MKAKLPEVPEGHTVRFTHHRIPRLIPVDKLGGFNETTAPKGGHTKAEIYRGKIGDQDLAATGVAFCSPRDPYNKSVGRAIALGRALKVLRDHDEARGRPVEVSDDRGPIPTLPQGAHHYSEGGSGA